MNANGLTIDLNADLGEGCDHDRELLSLITSANIACGFHAGDPAMMHATLAAAKQAGVSVGAHPSLHDREHFGRRELPITPYEAFALVAYQIGAFAAVARAVGIEPRHVKLHGALYNMTARDRILADAIARSISATDPKLLVFAPPGSCLADAAVRLGLGVAREFFADRNYMADGALVPRSHPEALLDDADLAAARVVRLLREGVVRTIEGTELALEIDTICLHGDSPQAVQFAQRLSAALLAEGIQFADPMHPVYSSATNRK